MPSAPVADCLDPTPGSQGQARDVAVEPPQEPVLAYWCLRGNCALAPAQLAWMLSLPAAVSLAVSTGFWWLGATWVLPFACVETLALVLAYVLYARRTLKRDEVTLTAKRLVVRRQHAGGERMEEWPLAWVQVACGVATDHLIEIRSAGRCVRVGQELTRAQRVDVARAIHLALRRTNDVST